MAEIQKQIGENIKRFRENKNFSQGDLAKALKVDRSYISSLERGQRNPSVLTLEKLAKALNVKAEKLIIAPAKKHYQWIRIVEERDTEIFPFYAYARAWGMRIGEIMGKNLSPVALVFTAKAANYYVDEPSYINYAKKVFKKTANQAFYQKAVQRIERSLQVIGKKTKEMEGVDFKRWSNEKLFKTIENLMGLLEEANKWGQLMAMMEYGPNNFLIEGTMDVLDKANKKYKLKQNTVEVSSLLSTPVKTTAFREQGRGLFKIAREILKDNRLKDIFQKKNLFQIEAALGSKQAEIFNLIKKHYQQYTWINYGYTGPALTIADFISELKQIVKENSLLSLENKIKEKEEEFNLLEAKQRELEKKFHLDKKWQRRFAVIRDQVLLKELRKEAGFHILYVAGLMQKEITQRTGLSLKELRQLLMKEYPLIERKKEEIKELIKKRMELCVYLIENSQEKVLVGEEAKRLADAILVEQKAQQIDEIRGSCAMKGNVRGRVKIVMGEGHLHKMQKGNILVSFSTNPQMITAMRKAAAIVTDQGGISSHAALVSRELGVPCLVGAKVATQVLRDGDLVEVNAAKGTLRVLKRRENE